jgi:hypothetical protein
MLNCRFVFVHRHNHPSRGQNPVFGPNDAKFPAIIGVSQSVDILFVGINPPIGRYLS